MAETVVANAPLLEREEELGRLMALLDEARGGHGRLVLIEGEAGIGKSALLRAVRAAAERGQITVLRARGGELERDFPHGVARQLYEPVVRDSSGARRRELLRGAAHLAAPVLGVADAGPSGVSGVDASFAANHGLYWLTVELSDEAPLALVIDDAHWADEATLVFLEYLGRRLDELPVLVAIALRPPEPGTSRELLDAIAELPVAETVHPNLLTGEASGKLIEQLTGEAPRGGFARACHEATGGNPFLLKELVRAFAADAAALDETAVQRVRELGPGSIARSVLGRLGRLWPEAVALAQAVAVLDTDAEFRHAASLAGLDHAKATDAADSLTVAEVLAPGRPLRFLHPIIRRAVHDDMPAGRVAAEHARAARILGAEGGDPDRAAVHLLPTEPVGDGWVVEHLRAAAERALTRGAPAAASGFLRRALKEPPGGEERPGLLLELGRAARLAGEVDAFDLLAEALEDATDVPTRVVAAEELGLALVFFGELERGLEVLETTAKALGEDRDARLRLEAALLMLSALLDPVAQRAEERLEQLLPEVGDESITERMLLAAAALHRANGMSGSREENLALAERAAAENLIVTEGSAIGIPWIGPAAVFAAYDMIDRADEIFEAAITHAQECGSSTELTSAWAMRGMLRRCSGDLIELEESARTAAEAAPAFGTFLVYRLASLLASALLEQGRPEDADAVLSEYEVRHCPCAPLSSGRNMLVARAQVHAAASRTSEALADAREAARRSAERGTAFIFIGLCWSTALALHAAGAPSDEAVEEAHRELAVARRFGCPSVEGIAILVLGIAAGGDEALARFEEAARRLEQSPRRLDYARALVELGSALRRSNRRSAAREPLTRGMEIAHRCGAAPLAERAREELRACGARPRKFVVSGVDALTASERRVARMAAEGLTNTQIAQALFVTRKTVETHLGHIYRKLDIASRGELAGALGREAAGTAGSTPRSSA